MGEMSYPSRRDRLLLGLAWAVMAAAYLWMQRAALSILPGDEAIYLYDGRLLAAGFEPYRDFFLAHPPMRVLVASLFSLAGSTPAVIKGFDLIMFPVAAGLLALAVLHARRWWWAALAAFLFMFATLSLDIGGVYMGPGLVMPLLAGSLLAATRRRFALAGLLLSIAGLQATYALMPLPVLAWWAFSQRRLGQFLAGTSAFVVGYLACYAVFGMPFVDQVVLYHVAKVDAETAAIRWGPISYFITTEAGLLAFSAASITQSTDWGRRATIAGWLCVLVAASYQALFIHYFAISLPFLAAGSAMGLGGLAQRFLPKLPAIRRLAIVLFCAALMITHLPHVLYGLDLHEQRIMQARDARTVVEAVSAHRPSSGMIWGDGSIVPLVALQSGLEIALNMVDTNEQRFSSGRTAPADVVSELSALSKPPGVLLLEEHGVYMVPELRKWVETNLIEVFSIRLPAMGHVCRYYLGRDDAQAIRQQIEGRTTELKNQPTRSPSGTTGSI